MDAAKAVLDGGARVLQFRHKEFWSAAAVDEAALVAELCAGAGARFIVNDRADYAALLHAGLHVGQDDLSPSQARLVVGADSIVGYSTHDPRQLAAADMEPIDYAAFGPVFDTSSKLNPDATVGLPGLRHARAITRKPLVAIGGISLETAASVWDAGADSIAVIGAILHQPCTPEQIAARIAAWIRLGAAG